MMCWTSAVGPGETSAPSRCWVNTGHRAVGLEGAPSAASHARSHSGSEVLEQSLYQLDLPSQRYDGVFTNAMLFQLPSQVLPKVLVNCTCACVQGCVFFSSNPHGNGEEGWNVDHNGPFHDWPTWRALAIVAGFDEFCHFYRPTGLPFE